MNLLKNITKAIARRSNDSIYNKQSDNIHKKAYQLTGKDLKHNPHLNGHKQYKKNLALLKRKNEQAHNRRDKFINDL